ncbi:hypothetical protein ABPG72_014002 [Tetrahymena utriculariae]
MKEAHIQWLRAQMVDQRLVGKTASEIYQKLQSHFGANAPKIKKSSVYYTLKRKLRWSYSYPVYQKEKTNDPTTLVKRQDPALTLTPFLEKPYPEDNKIIFRNQQQNN